MTNFPDPQRRVNEVPEPPQTSGAPTDDLLRDEVSDSSQLGTASAPVQPDQAQDRLDPQGPGPSEGDDLRDDLRSGTGEMIGATGDTQDGLQKDPEHWVTGDDPMTPAQKSYLDTLAREAGEQLPADLTKAQASEHIDRLQKGRDAGTN